MTAESPAPACAAELDGWLAGAGCGPPPWAAWLLVGARAHGVPAGLVGPLTAHGPAALSASPGDWGALERLVRALPVDHHGAVLRGLIAVGDGATVGAGVARALTLSAALGGATAPEAAAVGAAIDLLRDSRAVLLDPIGPRDPIPPDGPLLRALRRRPKVTEAVNRVTAGRLVGPARVTRLRAALGGADLLPHLDALADEATAPWEAIHPAIAQAWRRGWSRCRSAAKMTAWLTAARGGEPACLPSPAARSVERAAAIAWIEADPLHRRSWEHQRWGLAGSPSPKLGRDYVSMVILRALVEAGVEGAASRLAHLVAGLPSGPLRYYGDWDGIPPDCDSLGLALLCAQQTGAATAQQRAAWLAPLRPSLGPGCSLPVWLELGPDGPTCPEPRWRFGGGACGASRAMALRGLLADDPVTHGDVLDANLAAVVCGVAHGGAHAPFYYRPPTAARIVGDLVAEVTRDRPQTRGLSTAVTAVEALRDRARREQGPDGGWGSPLATAERLRLLSGGSGGRLAAERGLRYLSERQQPDGSWASEPLFLTLGKPPFPTHAHGGTELTTAVCLVGFDAAARTLAEP